MKSALIVALAITPSTSFASKDIADSITQNASKIEIKNDVLAVTENPNILIGRYVNGINELLNRGEIFTAKKKISEMDKLFEENKEFLDRTKITQYHTTKLRYDEIINNKMLLEKDIDKLNELSYEDALKHFQSIDLIGKESAYQSEIKQMKNILGEKLAKENISQEIEALKESFNQLEDSDYEEARESLNQFEEKDLDEKQKETINGLYAYVDQMEVRANDNYTEPEVTYTTTFDTIYSNSSPVTYTVNYSGIDSNFVNFVDLAYQQLGKAYVWGSSNLDGPYGSADCSGLVKYLYQRQFGINLPHNAQMQSNYGREVSDLKAGDLLFFGTSRNNITHVGVMSSSDGSGKYIHASSPSVGIVEGNINNPWSANRLVSARRIVE